jgi:hypothetical protein
MSPTIFISYLERVMDAIRTRQSGVSVNGTLINNLRFADDIDLIETALKILQENLSTVKTEGEKAGLRINIGKTKSMVFGESSLAQPLKVENNEIENVSEFVYLGSLLTWDNDCSAEIKRRIAKAMGAMAGLRTIWKSKHITLQLKMKLLKVCVFSILLYACESWTLKKSDKDRLLAFEMKCYRWILHIRWQQKISNEKIRRQLEATRNVYQTVIERKLKLFGHICRMGDDRLVKTVVFGRMQGKARKGRPCREWLDDVTDWCQTDIQKLYHGAADRTTWQRIVQHVVDTNG